MGHFENRLKEEGNKLQRIDDLKGQRIQDLLISIKCQSGHIHTVLPDNEQAKIKLIEDLQSDLPVKPLLPNQPPKQVIFKNRQAWGDICVMTAAVRDFKAAFPDTEVGVITTASHLWDHNPHINHQLKKGNVVEIGPGYLTNASNRTDLHFVNAFRISMEQKLNISIPQGLIKTDLWMTQEEIDRKPLIDGPYWILVPNGAPGWPLKMYWAWEEVIDILKDDIQIVQIGMKGQYKHIPGTIDYRGKTQDGTTGIRDVINLFYNCEGSMGLVSAHAHIISSFGYPCVVVAGAREPAHFTHYQNHQYLSTDGCLPCAQTACWKCKSEGCSNLLENNIPKCAKLIEPEEVARAVRRYYDGGVLEYGKKRKRPTYKNVVKETNIFVAPKPEEVDEKLLGQYGFKWGGGSLTDRDWMFMKDIFKEEKIETVLEFGCGLSSLLMGTMVKKIITYETMPGWINKIKPMADPKKHEFRTWDGITVPVKKEDLSHFDFIFVDGPAGGENREWSTKFASEHSDLIIVHDAGRVPERKWQAKYLEKDFKLIAKGGHRCHLWKRTDKIVEKKYEVTQTSKPIAKMITTTRGYGGSERSSIEIMRMLQEKDYHVQLCPTGNVSWEYKKNIPDGVQVLPEWNHVTATCDLAVFYCSDTIWNYNKDQYTSVMSNMDAKRKVMVVNFKVGGVGQVEWTKGWDEYLFLSSLLEEATIKRMPGIKTKVMAPPTSLDLFFKNTVNYSFPLRLIRHNSQGDNKHHPDTDIMFRDILRLDSSIEFYYMPAYSKMMDHPQIYKYPKNKPPVWDFLRQGNLFWYRLPDGYTEGGPKVIMEAMASGLAVIADNHSGPKDRVTEETGWLCDNWNDYIEVIKYILNNPNELMKKGIAARKHAKKYFIQERWIEEIIG